MKKNFHVLFIPLFFILYLYEVNVEKVLFNQIYLSLIIVLILACFFYTILKSISHSSEKGALLGSLLFFLFFNLDGISQLIFPLINKINPSQTPLSQTRLSGYCGIFLGVLYLSLLLIVLRHKTIPRMWNRMANLFSIGMLGIVLGTILFTRVQKTNGQVKSNSDRFYTQWQDTIKSEANYLQAGENLPDIYYIILDGYGSADVLNQYYNLDNRPFLETLTDLGFKVAQNSLANYKQTNPSIASMLNMDYIDLLEDDFGDSFNYQPLNYMIHNNRVIEQFHRLGYRVDAFSTGFSPTEFFTADKIYHPALHPNEFEMLVIASTPLRYLLNDELHAIHRERVRFTLENIAAAGAQTGPDLVLAHVLSPHPPFVFNSNGESITPQHPFSTFDASDFMQFGTVEEYKTGYVNQIAYVNRAILSTVQEILRESETSPIIILQGDHGPGANFNHLVLDVNNLGERYPILYAAYIPCGSGNPIPDDITPVNSFRYISNACFAAKLTYLENRQYFSSTLSPYLFTDVTRYVAARR